MRVLIMFVGLMLCIGIAKQEKAQPALPQCDSKLSHLPCWNPCAGSSQGTDCKTYVMPLSNHPQSQPLPFDLPAKEWDGPDTHAKDTCAEAPHDCALVYIAVPNHHVSCKDVATDWKQRVMLDSADGKHHCYAFYILEQKP